MRIAAGSLLSVLLFSASSHAATVFVPVVNAAARPVPSQMFPFQNVGWVSTLTVSNPVETPLTFRYTAVFGGAFAYIADGCGGSRTVTPNMSWQFDCVSPGAGGIGFVQMDLDSGLASTAAIHLEAARNCCGVPYPTLVSLASAPLPVYDSLFPASSVVTSTEIVDLPGPADTNPSRDLNDPLTRRVNLTIFNAGQEAATAKINAIGTTPPPAPAGRDVAAAAITATPIVITLQGGEVRQVNEIFPVSDYRVLVVTVSQPFLCYASSIITYSDPARAPALAVYSFQQVQ